MKGDSMKKEPIVYILQELSHFVSPVKEEQVRKSILENTKEKRKGLTKEEILEKGLHIYEKRGVSVDQLIEDVVDREMVELSFDMKDDKWKLQITEKGLSHLIAFYTEHDSEEFLIFEKEVNNLTRKLDETDFPRLSIAGMYHNKRTIGDIEQIYFTDRAILVELRSFHDYYMKKLGVEAQENEFVLHLAPKIFLPVSDIEADVSLEIEGVNTPYPIVLGKPYRNKRYVVAGTHIEQEKLLTGFYPIVANREDFPQSLSVRYIWTVGNKKVIHELELSFTFDRGSLFSSEQSFNRSVVLPFINLSTFIEDVTLLGRNRDVSMIVEGNITTIREKVTLTSLPTHLHSAFYGNSTFQKWNDKRK
jgi:hypothetical protein